MLIPYNDTNEINAKSFMEKVPLWIWDEDDFYFYGSVCNRMGVEPDKRIKDYFERKIVDSQFVLE